MFLFSGYYCEHCKKGFKKEFIEKLPEETPICDICKKETIYGNRIEIFTRLSSDYPTIRFTEEKFKDILQKAANEPHPLSGLESGKRWWLFVINDKPTFWIDNEDLSPVEVKALITKKLKKLEKLVKSADMEALADTTQLSREQISDEVKMFVWQRDGGKCVKCGSREKLEFDHIIPFSKGGSSTARNIQILCETCNRSKRDSLT